VSIRCIHIYLAQIGFAWFGRTFRRQSFRSWNSESKPEAKVTAFGLILANCNYRRKASYRVWTFTGNDSLVTRGAIKLLRLCHPIRYHPAAEPQRNIQGAQPLQGPHLSKIHFTGFTSILQLGASHDQTRVVRMQRSGERVVALGF